MGGGGVKKSKFASRNLWMTHNVWLGNVWHASYLQSANPRHVEEKVNAGLCRFSEPIQIQEWNSKNLGIWIRDFGRNEGRG